jgi:anti-sigma regulatory factor (Ser/Thr protein kinase)
MEVGTSSVLMLPYAASSVGVARRRLIGDLTEAGVYEATACDAGLVLSELISNALRHATPLPGAAVRVSWRLDDDCIEVSVSDGGGPTVPVASEPGGSAIGGRGLGIVDRLSVRWGVCTNPGGARETTVWALLALHCDDVADAAVRSEDSCPRAADAAAGPIPGLVTAATRDA